MSLDGGMSGFSPAEVSVWGPARMEQMYGLTHRWTEDGGYATPAEWWDALARAVAGELHAPDDLPGALRFAFEDGVVAGDTAKEALRGPHAPAVLTDFVSRLETLERATPDAVAQLFKELRATFRERHAMRGRDVMFAVRAALSGTIEGPCLEVVVCLLGRRRCAERARRQLNLIAGDTE